MSATPSPTPAPTTPVTPTEAPTSLVNAPAVENPLGGQAEAPTEGQPTVEQPKVEAPAPLTAEAIVVPEGFEIAEGPRDEFLSIMNDAALDPVARANALIALQAKLSQEASEAGSQAWETLQSTWRTEVENDPEIGGAKLAPTLHSISKLFNEFGSQEVRDAFDHTGAGNNPHIVKFMAKLAAQLTEGRPVVPSGVTSQENLADTLYNHPSSKRK